MAFIGQTRWARPLVQQRNRWQDFRDVSSISHLT